MSTCNGIWKEKLHNSITWKKKKNGTEEKKEVVQKLLIMFPDEARLKTINTKARFKTNIKNHLIDLILNSPRIRLSQSENIKLDNRE